MGVMHREQVDVDVSPEEEAEIEAAVAEADLGGGVAADEVRRELRAASNCARLTGGASIATKRPTPLTKTSRRLFRRSHKMQAPAPSSGKIS
jgi:hypothetical protein